MYSTLVTMVIMTPPVSTPPPPPVKQHRSYTLLWYKEIPSAEGGGERNQNFGPLAPDHMNACKTREGFLRKT